MGSFFFPTYDSSTVTHHVPLSLRWGISFLLGWTVKQSKLLSCRSQSSFLKLSKFPWVLFIKLSLLCFWKNTACSHCFPWRVICLKSLFLRLQHQLFPLQWAPSRLTVTHHSSSGPQQPEESYGKATEPEFINWMLRFHKYNSFQTNSHSLLKEFLKVQVHWWIQKSATPKWEKACVCGM